MNAPPTTTQPSPLDHLIRQIAEDSREVVADIERSPQMTQGHYGRYMSLLSTLGKGEARQTKVIALAFIQAGANPQGIRSALKILFPV